MNLAYYRIDLDNYTLVESLRGKLTTILGADWALYFLDYYTSNTLTPWYSDIEWINVYMRGMNPLVIPSAESIKESIEVVQSHLELQSFDSYRVIINSTRYAITSIILESVGNRVMNYWFEAKNPLPDTLDEEKALDYGLQLYMKLIEGVHLKWLRTVEVGSGMWWWAKYLSRTQEPTSYIWIDASWHHIHSCNASLANWKLKFICGNAEDIPLLSNSADVVLNLESAHCYSNREKFIQEVARILNNGWILCLSDFFTQAEMQELLDLIKENGFENITVEDITASVEAWFILYLPEILQLKDNAPTDQERQIYERIIQTRAFKTSKSNWRGSNQQLSYWKIKAQNRK